MKLLFGTVPLYQNDFFYSLAVEPFGTAELKGSAVF